MSDGASSAATATRSASTSANHPLPNPPLPPLPQQQQQQQQAPGSPSTSPSSVNTPTPSATPTTNEPLQLNTRGANLTVNPQHHHIHQPSPVGRTPPRPLPSTPRSTSVSPAPASSRNRPPPPPPPQSPLPPLPTGPPRPLPIPNEKQQQKQTPTNPSPAPVSSPEGPSPVYHDVDDSTADTGASDENSKDDEEARVEKPSPNVDKPRPPSPAPSNHSKSHPESASTHEQGDASEPAPKALNSVKDAAPQTQEGTSTPPIADDASRSAHVQHDNDKNSIHDRSRDASLDFNTGRRESLASTSSGRSGRSGRTSNGGSTASARMAQRKMMMAQQMSLGLDAEIKAEEAAATPKRRSIFRTSGTASTPDLSTLIRGKSKGGNKNQSASRDKAKQQLAKAHHPASSPGAAASSHQSLTSHMSTSTSSLTGRNRERRLEPQRNEWDHYHGPDAARQMATIVETVTEPSPRAPSIDDGPSKMGQKRGKTKGMFGRMFGSTSSGKDHSHGPLTSSSQISLSARSNVDISSPPAQASPPLPPTANSYPSPQPQFPGNAQYAFDGQTQQQQGATNGTSRPPIPQRPSQPIIPKEHRSSVASHHSHSSHGGHQEVIVIDQQQPREQQRGHTRQASVTSIASNMEAHTISPKDAAQHVVPPPPPPPPPRSERADSHDQQQPRSRPPSRRPTVEDRPQPRHAGSSFTDDVTGLLDRIGHVEANNLRSQAAAAAALAHDPESDHLQVSPDLASSRYQRTPSPYTDRSPSLYHPGMSRKNTSDGGQMADPLPVPSGEPVPIAASDANSAVYDLTPVDTTVDADNGGHVVGSPPQSPDGEWHNNTGASSSQIAIEVTSSPGQSTTNLPDIDADEERGRRLAAEFIEGDQTHVTSDKVAMFLGGPRHINNAALRYYMQYFDMRGLKLDQAFRDLCAKLHLKAESQEIDRIIEAFSARFHDCNPTTVFGTPGVVHTVTGAMLMLNTDLHIADLQKHMSRADFVRNAMRAIQESMPSDRESTPDVTNNDSGSLRNVDSASASQSTTSVRLRAATSRNTSGTLTTELTSPSTQELRSRAASSTTVNSFTYTKAWEIEAETALKEIFTNVRNERILLPMSSTTSIERQSSATLGGFGKGVSGAVAGAMSGIKRNTRNQGNSPYGAMFSHSDGRLSPTPSYPNSIGDQQFQALAPALGFAGNLSHTVIREQEDEAHSVQSKETMGSLEELNDDELALLGAPWAKEGLLHRKIQVEAQGRKPQKKDWKQYFVVIQRGDLHMFVFGSGGGSSMGGGAVGGGNWMTNAKTSGEYSLMHAMAMALPKPGYSASRPYCFTVTFPSGEISVFQAGTEELVAEWVATCNYWAARRSRQPLVGGVSNIEYGWTRVQSLEEEQQHEPRPAEGDRASMRSARSQITRLGAINRVRGQGASSGSLDKITINDWKPPPHATIPSTLEEEAQLESLCAYVQSLKEELNQHKSIEEPMVRLYTPGSKNANKARDNWTAKSRYIHSEIFKYETYVEALRNAIAQRVERQGQRKLERALARSTVSLHADLSKTQSRGLDARDALANGAVSPGRADSMTDDGSGYVTADVDEAR